MTPPRRAVMRHLVDEAGPVNAIEEGKSHHSCPSKARPRARRPVPGDRCPFFLSLAVRIVPLDCADLHCRVRRFRCGRRRSAANSSAIDLRQQTPRLTVPAVPSPAGDSALKW